jgi:Family of unknown function (DUF6496)
MTDKATQRRVADDRRNSKSSSTQAGEFVRQEMDHIRQGKHGAQSAKQAIAIGLSEARRAGVKVPTKKASATAATPRKAKQDTAASKHPRKPSPTRSRATEQALRREPRVAAFKTALSRHARTAASKRTASSRSASARKAARTRARRDS